MWGARASSEPHPGWPLGAIGSQHTPGRGDETDSEVRVSHLGQVGAEWKPLPMGSAEALSGGGGWGQAESRC